MRSCIAFLFVIINFSCVYAFGQNSAGTAQESIKPYSGIFAYGVNFGYYNASWSDEQLAGLAQKVGAHSVRPTLPEAFVERYGYGIRQQEFMAYANTYGLRELTCFVEGPSPQHRDNTKYDGSAESSRLFANLYEPIWNGDGSVNQQNYYAYYFYRLLLTYGGHVRFWEIVNEPDFANGSGLDAWLTRPPRPDELPNLRAPLFHYIRMLRISYELAHKYRPDAYVTTGGIGHPQFLDALLRYTDNPAGGTITAAYPRTGGAYLDALSFHSYPAYSLHSWDTSRNGFRYFRTSDYAIEQLLRERQALTDVLDRYGYNGSKYPTKHLLLSETNISRRTSDDRTGTDDYQRNYITKTLVLAQKNDIRQLYLYQLGESVNAPAPGTPISGTDELGLMGLYENLKRNAPGAQRTTAAGEAFATTSRLLYGWRYDATRTAGLALPTALQGAAFSKDGAYTYVLWARALTDNSEQAQGTYSFPAAWNLSGLDRYEWNYAATNAKTAVGSQGLTLTGSPSFFVSTATTTTATPPPVVSGTGCADTGGLLREEWAGLSGGGLWAVPAVGTPPTSQQLIRQFEAPALGGAASYQYAARLRGYICPPQTGRYTFWLAADDAGELALSPDADPARARVIASCTSWTSSARDFERYASQRSVAIELVAGQRYYVELRHKQAWGPGYAAVAWQRPDGVRQEPIPGTNLIPFQTTIPALGPTPTLGPVASGQVRVTFTFARPISAASSRVAPLLYNKSRALNIELDDSPVTAYTDLYPLLRGGVRNGQTYPGLRFTDGSGHSRSYTAAVAVNGRNAYNNSVWLDAGPNHDASRLVWSQAQELLRNGWDIENHSDLHTGDNPAQQIATLDALIAQRLDGYKPSVHIVPSSYAGYPRAAFAAGYQAVSSNSQSDGLPLLNAYNGNRIALSALPKPGLPFVYNRYLADANAGESRYTLASRLKGLSDALMAPGTNASEVYLQRVFTHGIAFDALADWLTYTRDVARDRLWVTTLREFADYWQVSSQVRKTETISGNTLTVDLDYTNVSYTTRFRHLTLLAEAPATVTKIAVTGADSVTYNTETKLVNIFRGGLTSTTTATPPPVVSGTGCADTGGLLREEWAGLSGGGLWAVPAVGTPPTSQQLIRQFEAPALGGAASYQYAARLRGYICPPQTGRYTFWLAADDAGELALSPDADPARARVIASCTSWTSSARDFERYASQRSVAIELVAGQRYYVELRHKQAWGPGYAAVAWQRPDGVRQEPIPGTNLIPFQTTAPINLKDPSANLTAEAAPTAIGTSVGPGAKVSGEAAATSAEQLTQVVVYPNPLRGTQGPGRVRFQTAHMGTATLTLFNASGQLVHSLFSGPLPANTPQTVELPGKLNAGLYFVRLVTDTEVVGQRLVVEP